MLNTLTVIALTALVAGTELKVGDVAPAFTLTDCDGQARSLTDLLKHGPVVLAFFPKAFTPGCTRELTAYSRSIESFATQHVTVVAISNDDAETLRKFRGELKASYLFLPDQKGQLIEAYGVRQWPLRLAKRTTFVVDPSGRITRIDTGDDAIDVSRALTGISPASR